MKKFLRIFFIVLSVLSLACGSATDVGNPTGTVPTTQTLTGQIDVTTVSLLIDDTQIQYAMNAIANESDFDANAVVFTITAEAEEEDLSYSSTTDESGNFSIEVAIEYSYSFYVSYQGEEIGQFEFKQDAQGQRGPNLDVPHRTTEIDMGRIQFEGNVFIPEYEPFDGFQSSSPDNENH